jgi:hypothetical protein
MPDNRCCMQCKGQKANRLSYPQFKLALRHIADKLGWDLETVHARIVNSQGPLVNNITLPQHVRQHDDPCGGSPSHKSLCSFSYWGDSPTHKEQTPSAFKEPASAFTPTAFARTPSRMRSATTPVATTPVATTPVRRARSEAHPFTPTCWR